MQGKKSKKLVKIKRKIIIIKYSRDKINSKLTQNAAQNNKKENLEEQLSNMS